MYQWPRIITTSTTFATTVHPGYFGGKISITKLQFNGIIPPLVIQLIADIPYPSVEYTIYTLEVCNIHRGEAEVNIISPRVNKSYIQRERVWNICFISYHADFKRSKEKYTENTWYSWVIAKFCPMLIKFYIGRVYDPLDGPIQLKWTILSVTYF